MIHDEPTKCTVSKGAAKRTTAAEMHEQSAEDEIMHQSNIEFHEEIKMSSQGAEEFKFTSTFSTYMTLLGYSMGMSDFWRFPFLAYRNGGGKHYIALKL